MDGSGNGYYGHLYAPEEFDDIAAIYSSDDDEDSSGHPHETKGQVLENLASGFPYNKGGPAREYDWTAGEISKMAQLIRDRDQKVRQELASNPRKIRGQDYLGQTSNNHLLKWINSVRSGKRFAHNPKISRGPSLKYGQWTNHRQWEYVSSVLIAEFHYWIAVEKQNRKLGPGEGHLARYPKLSDLIFRNNEDFTGGLWSNFYQFWEPFITEMRYEPLTNSFDNFII